MPSWVAHIDFQAICCGCLRCSAAPSQPEVNLDPAPLDDRVIEFVDHLHEHFLTPVQIRNGRYLLPTAPGYSIQIRKQSLMQFTYPTGKAWSEPS